MTSKSYDPVSKRVDMTVEVFFHRGYSKPVRLNVAQLQDQMNWMQTFYPASGGSTKLYPYFHDHVLRQIIPSDEGEVIVSGIPVTSQSTITKTFSFISVDSTIETSNFVVYVHQSDNENFGEILQCEELDLASFVTDVRPLPEDAALTLHQNYPNPFNPSTMISYDLPERSNVTLVVTDALGRVVERLAEGTQESGRHSVSFSGSALPSGTYYVTLRAGDVTQTRSMTLLR